MRGRLIRDASKGERILGDGKKARKLSSRGQIAPNAPRIGRLMRQIRRALIAANGQPLRINVLLG